MVFLFSFYKKKNLRFSEYSTFFRPKFMDDYINPAFLEYVEKIQMNFCEFWMISLLEWNDVFNDKLDFLVLLCMQKVVIFQLFGTILELEIDVIQILIASVLTSFLYLVLQIAWKKTFAQSHKIISHEVCRQIYNCYKMNEKQKQTNWASIWKILFNHCIFVFARKISMKIDRIYCKYNGQWRKKYPFRLMVGGCKVIKLWLDWQRFNAV